MQSRGVVGLAPGDGKWARYRGSYAHPESIFNEYIDSCSQGKDVEDVDIVVTLSDHV